MDTLPPRREGAGWAGEEARAPPPPHLTLPFPHPRRERPCPSARLAAAAVKVALPAGSRQVSAVGFYHRAGEGAGPGGDGVAQSLLNRRCSPAPRSGPAGSVRVSPEPGAARGGRPRLPVAGRAEPATRGPGVHPDCVFLVLLFPPQLTGPAGGNAADPSSPPVRLIQGLPLFLRGEGGGVREGGDEGGIKTNNSDRCKGQTGQRPQRLPSVSFCRKGLILAGPRRAQAPALPCPRRGLVAVTAGSLIIIR